MERPYPLLFLPKVSLAIIDFGLDRNDADRPLAARQYVASGMSSFNQSDDVWWHEEPIDLTKK